jgi:hypothetical protein
MTLFRDKCFDVKLALTTPVHDFRYLFVLGHGVALVASVRYLLLQRYAMTVSRYFFSLDLYVLCCSCWQMDNRINPHSDHLCLWIDCNRDAPMKFCHYLGVVGQEPWSDLSSPHTTLTIHVNAKLETYQLKRCPSNAHLSCDSNS